MKIHFIHDWNPYEIVRKEVVETNTGALIAYCLQEKRCKICGRVKFKISNIDDKDWKIRFE